jgi:prepilin-type N-terminal cleavage/methylation domain-containing protein
VSRRNGGFSLIELLTVVAILGLVFVVSVPAFGKMRRRAALVAATSELRSVFHLTRSRAIARGVNCGMKFELLGGQWQFSVYEDGDRDGVRNDDIKKGIDKRVARPRTVFRHDGIVSIGLLDIPIKDPDGDPLGPNKSPVAFNKSAICSFSPYGESTPGTIYLTDGGRNLWAVRVFGATAKMRVLHYDRGTRKWKA